MYTDLEALLREAIKHETISRRTRSRNRLKEIDAAVHSFYSNPANWRTGKCVSLIHRSADGTETSLGLFVEHNHLKTDARRLSRVESGTVEGVEIVCGNYWIDPTPPSTPYDEVDEIRAYLARRKTAEVKASIQQLCANELLEELTG